MEDMMNMETKNGQVLIPDIAGFTPDEYVSSVHGAQARILQYLVESIDYDDLLCYSGFAFRLGIHDLLCPSAAHPSCGFPCIDNSRCAIPWKLKFFDSLAWNYSKKDSSIFKAEARQAIVDSVDKGIPVQYGNEEDGLIIGYADEGRRWRCFHPYHKLGERPRAFWYDEASGFAGGNSWPWGLVIWLEPKTELERVREKTLTISALKQAIQMWVTERIGAYYVGGAAYRHWLKWLRAVEKNEVPNPKSGMQGNCWCLHVLVHSRRIAGKWLYEKANLFDHSAAGELREAAMHFSKIAEICMERLSHPCDLALHPERFNEWTSAMREEQIAKLEASQAHDQAAIVAIGKALTTGL